jgi:hypothetical protein
MQELIQQIISQLNISEDQAKGGAGLIFKLAKEKLGDADWSQLAGKVPGAEELAGAAPEEGGLSSLVGGLTSALGGKAEALGDLSGLASGFKKLNLDADLVGKFVPVVLSFVKSKGGDELVSLMQNLLGKFAGGSD